MHCDLRIVRNFCASRACPLHDEDDLLCGPVARAPLVLPPSEMRTGKMDMKVGSTKDKTTTASLDWTFEQGGYKGTVKGTVDLLVCRD